MKQNMNENEQLGTNSTGMKINLKRPSNILSNIIVMAVVGLGILLGIIFIFYFKNDEIIAILKLIGGAISNGLIGIPIELLSMTGICIGLFIVLIISFYLIRSSYIDLNSKNGLKKYVSRAVYIFGNIYGIIVEVLLYGCVFMVGFYFSFPKEANNAIQFLALPTITGLVFMIVVYFIFSIILHSIFKKYYGGLLLLTERKWNRDGIDAIASGLFIISIISSLIGLLLEEYKFTKEELELLFGISIFSIALYVIKCLKNFSITYYESK